MVNTKDFILKIKFLMNAISIIIFIKFSLKFLSLNTVIAKVKKRSSLFLSRNDPEISINRINFWYIRLNKFFRIKSCFKNSLIKKLLFSSFGYDLVAVCGVRLDSRSKIEGHAWLCYKKNIIFEDPEYLKTFTESFRI